MPATSAALDREWSVLLAACSTIPAPDRVHRLQTLLRQPIRWKLLNHRAEEHGLQPLLHQPLSAVEQHVPHEEMLMLNQHFKTNLHKALLLSRELIRIVDHLTALNIPVMPYKGVALAEAVYGDIALRQSGDIDLLIKPQDLAVIRDAVRDLGYTPHLNFSAAEERAYLKSGYEYAFDGPGGPNLLELQWALQPRFYAVDFDMDALFQRAVNGPVVSQPMRTPSLEDLFLILSLHAAKHAWARLVWLCDIDRMMSLRKLNWDWIGSQAESLGVVRILRVGLLLANRLLGAAIPTAAERNLPPDSEAVALVEEIETHILNESTYHVESMAYFRLMLRLRERQADRLRFLRRLIFTPGPGEWGAVRLPPPLFPLYGLVRLSRLAARFVKR